MIHLYQIYMLLANGYSSVKHITQTKHPFDFEWLALGSTVTYHTALSTFIYGQNCMEIRSRL